MQIRKRLLSIKLIKCKERRSWIDEYGDLPIVEENDILEKTWNKSIVQTLRQKQIIL